MTMLTNRFEQAFLYASHVHGGHKRKGTSIPYLSHLMGVASLVLEHGGTEDQAIAALLHDAVEDQGGEERLADIRARFGEGVADIVEDCSDSKGGKKLRWEERKRAYIEHLRTKPDTSLLVSLADKTHNARAIVTDLQAHGAEVWDRFNAKPEQILWYYHKLLKVFSERRPSALTAELKRAVDEMHALVAR